MSLQEYFERLRQDPLRWGKPARDIRRGSTYVKWLNDYYETWFALASEFPEIGVWEVDNELNNPDFLCGVNGEKIYNVEQMAEIALDVLYYASSDRAGGTRQGEFPSLFARLL